MDIEKLKLIKNQPECCILNENILNKINSFFKESNIRYNKKTKKINNVFKNSNFNLKKNTIENKIIFILNKLSESNINNIVIEFIQNIKIDNQNTFDIIQKSILSKILKDSKFINIYCKFLIIIIKYCHIKYNYDYSYTFTLIDEYLDNYKNKEENERLYFLNFLVILENENFLKEGIINYISTKLIKFKFIPDLKLWFENYNLDKECLKNLDVTNIREKLLFQSIFDNNKKTKKNNINDINFKKVIHDTFITQCENIIEEYNYLKENEEIKYFIENECNSDIKKKNFINYLINIFFKKKNNNILNLINYIKDNKVICEKIIINVIKNYKNNKNFNKLLLKLGNISIEI